MAEAIHAPSSSAAQSCSAPPNGTSDGVLGLGQRPAASSRATSTATSQGASLEHRADLAARHALAEQRPAAVDQQQVDLLALGEPDQVGARVGRDERHGARRDALARSARRAPPRTSRGASRSSRFSVCRPPRDARSGAPRRAHQPGEDQLARRLGARQRLGERRAAARGPRRVCGATQDRRARAPRAPGTRHSDSLRASSSSSSTGAPKLVVGSSSRSSGPAMNVVTSAISTSAANSALGDHALLERQVEHDQLGEPARVHQRPDHRTRRASRSRSTRAATIAPTNLPTIATAISSQRDPATARAGRAARRWSSGRCRRRTAAAAG